MGLNSKIRPGGLMRCCIHTIEADHQPEFEGRVLQCLHCTDTMIFKDGVWQWNREEVSR